MSLMYCEDCGRNIDTDCEDMNTKNQCMNCFSSIEPIHKLEKFNMFIKNNPETDDKKIIKLTENIEKDKKIFKDEFKKINDAMEDIDKKIIEIGDIL